MSAVTQRTAFHSYHRRATYCKQECMAVSKTDPAPSHFSAALFERATPPLSLCNSSKHATSGMYGVDVQRKLSVWQHEVRGSEFLGQPMPGYQKHRLAWKGDKDATSDKQEINIRPDVYDGVK